MKVYLEVAPKKVFAVAIEWPGLARSGKTEEEALETLARYVPRYEVSLKTKARQLRAVPDVSSLTICGRVKGGSGTEFGVPSVIVAEDRERPRRPEFERQLGLLRAAWHAFVDAAAKTRGKKLATGPRGGGRTLEQIREHVAEADRAYISALGAKAPGQRSTWGDAQEAFVQALEAKLRGELPEVGPRGGERWPALYAIRRSAWHALDHAWELEDRAT